MKCRLSTHRSTYAVPYTFANPSPSPGRTHFIDAPLTNKQFHQRVHKKETRILTYLCDNGTKINRYLSSIKERLWILCSCLCPLPCDVFYTNFRGHGSQSCKHTSGAFIIIAVNCSHPFTLVMNAIVTISNKQITHICSYLLSLLLIDVLIGLAAYIDLY